MKKVLIVIDNLNTGGVATSLYNYLYALSDRVNFDLLVFNEDSIKFNKIPSRVNVLPTQRILHMLGKTNKEMQQESKLLSYIRIILQIVAKNTNGIFARKLIMQFIKNIGDYDLAIAYSQDDAWKNWSKGCVDFVLKKTNANKKAVIIHCDYKNFGGYNYKQVKQYDLLDNIICVSESCRNTFCQCFPCLESKTIVCENFTNIDNIIKKSNNAIKYANDKVNFITVCRISKEKGLRRTIEAFKELENEGFSNFTWTIVGDGPEKSNLVELTNSSNGVKNKITFIGNKSNPYPYIKNASFFLLPSENEAAPMVFGESAVLGIPIITTNTCSAIELVQNRDIGWVVDNSKEGIKYGIKNAIMGKYKKKESQKIININENPYKQFMGFYKSI